MQVDAVELDEDVVLFGEGAFGDNAEDSGLSLDLGSDVDGLDGLEASSLGHGDGQLPTLDGEGGRVDGFGRVTTARKEEDKGDEQGGDDGDEDGVGADIA